MSWLVFWAKSTAKDYIRATGDFHKELYIDERINEAEVRLEEQSEKTESCGENLWNEIQLKGPQRQKQTREQSKKEWASSVGLREKRKPQHPQLVKVNPRGQLKETIIMRCIYIVERTNTAEVRLEEQSEKTESCGENLWN